MFNHLKSIIETKKPLEEDLNLDSTFTPFIMQRWLSMYNEDFCVYLNETTNKLYGGLTNKNDWYKLFQSTLPSKPNKYIKYISKSKKTKSINDKYISFVAETLEISKREAEFILLSDSKLVKQLKNNLGE